jgi:hypothetical protein
MEKTRDKFYFEFAGKTSYKISTSKTEKNDNIMMDLLNMAGEYSTSKTAQSEESCY